MDSQNPQLVQYWVHAAGTEFYDDQIQTCIIHIHQIVPWCEEKNIYKSIFVYMYIYVYMYVSICVCVYLNLIDVPMKLALPLCLFQRPEAPDVHWGPLELRPALSLATPMQCLWRFPVQRIMYSYWDIYTHKIRIHIYIHIKCRTIIIVMILITYV